MIRRIYIDTSVVGGHFEVIKAMREIRDKFSIEIMDMSYEEEKAYLKELLKDKRRKAVQL
jgi:hypothetical protein